MGKIKPAKPYMNGLTFFWLCQRYLNWHHGPWSTFSVCVANLAERKGLKANNGRKRWSVLEVVILSVPAGANMKIVLKNKPWWLLFWKVSLLLWFTSNEIIDMALAMQMMRGGAAKKSEKLREMLEESGDLMTLQCALPLDPSVQLAGIVPQECSVFKSAMSPLRLTFRTIGKSPCLYWTPH